MRDIKINYIIDNAIIEEEIETSKVFKFSDKDHIVDAVEDYIRNFRNDIPEDWRFEDQK